MPHGLLRHSHRGLHRVQLHRVPGFHESAPLISCWASLVGIFRQESLAIEPQIPSTLFQGSRDSSHRTMPITQRIDQAVEWTKWPAPFSLSRRYPALCTQLTGNRKLFFFPNLFDFLFAGLGVVWFASRTDLRKSAVVKTLFRWMHDASQYAIATKMLHPVIAIRRERRRPSESRVRWLGKGNWIMLVAPYVIPLSAIFFGF